MKRNARGSEGFSGDKNYLAVVIKDLAAGTGAAGNGMSPGMLLSAALARSVGQGISSAEIRRMRFAVTLPSGIHK